MRESTKVLVVASAGGHWVQLCRLSPAWSHCDVAYVSTHKGLRSEVAPARFHVVRDANRWDKIGLLISALQMARVVLLERPQVVITTGAAPGYFAIRLAKLLGARTLWIDSIANAEELSLSGRQAGKHADALFTQWEHLAEPGGAKYKGAVL